MRKSLGISPDEIVLGFAGELREKKGQVFRWRGYNTIYECQALGVPLVAFAWQRLYDRQQLRVHLASAKYQAGLAQSPVVLVDCLESAIAAVGNLLNLPVSKSYSPGSDFVNGALSAISAIELCCNFTK